MFISTAFYQLLRSLLLPRLVLLTENLALRQQLAVLHRFDQAISASPSRSVVLDRLVAIVARLALDPGDRKTSDGD